MKHPRQLLVRIVAAVGIAIAPLACAPVATSPAGDAHVEAVAVRMPDGPRVAVTNRSSRPVFTLIIGRNAQPLALWAACADAEVCPPIAPGATRLEKPILVEGTAETEVIVHWWHAERGADGVMRPDSIRSFVVTL